MRLADHKGLEKALFLWFKRDRSSNLPVTGPILEEKARNIALQMGTENFKFSDGWLSRFKKHHGVVFPTIAGESATVVQNVCADWQQQKLQDVLSNEPSDIFNVDEMALFYKFLPNKTLSFKGEKCTGGKHSKDRITVLAEANMDGSKKLKLLVIGKTKRPRALVWFGG
ncbi:tigger transposable element-derived protein 4-like [Ixodes scapularis]